MVCVLGLAWLQCTWSNIFASTKLRLSSTSCMFFTYPGMRFTFSLNIVAAAPEPYE